jgi:ABC-type sugar transport system substrate-binding protein
MRRNRVWIGVLVFALAAATGFACDRDESSSKGGGGGSAGARPRVGYVLHGQNPFTRTIQHGAEDAGKALDADVQVQGPANFTSTDAVALFEGMVQRGVDGLVVIPMPGEVWVKPIRRAAEESKIPVMTANVTSPGSASTAWFGHDEFKSGVLLAGELRRQLQAAGKTGGKVVVGICVPGLSVLTTRYDGLEQGMEGSGFAVAEPRQVGTDGTANYNAWENLATANPDAVAMVGLCSMDLPNLAKLKQRTKAAWVVAGYDLGVETLDAVKAGTVQVVVGQHPYLQGYLPVVALIQHVRDKKPLPSGWVDVGTELITKENVDSVYQREADPAAETKWYADHVAKDFPDLAAVAKAMPAQ